MVWDTTPKNIGDMDRTRKRDGRTDGQTDGRTVRLLYASQSSFGGIKSDKMISKPRLEERVGSVVECLTLEGLGLEPHLRHCILSSKTLYSLVQPRNLAGRPVPTIILNLDQWL